MGDRAIISKNNVEFLAVHWRGYPESLGVELINAKTDKDIISIAEKHGIDAANKKVLSKLNKTRFDQISKRTSDSSGVRRYSPKDVEKLYQDGKVITFNVMTPSDRPIINVNDYDDFALYQYDLKDGKWRFRRINGSWKNADKSEPFEILNSEIAKNFCKIQEAQIDKKTINSVIKPRTFLQKLFQRKNVFFLIILILILKLIIRLII